VDGEKKRTMLVILGAGLFAEEIADIIAELDAFDLAGFIEGVSPERCRQTLCGLPIIWIDDIAPWIDDCLGICAVGSPKRKDFIQQAEKQGLRFTSVFHPSATIAKTATLGEGSIAGAGAVVAARARIGSHVILNRGCLIGHHGVIGDYVTVSPGANIAGKVHIGDQSYIGMGATVLDGISIGKGAVVGAGAVVTRDVPDRVQVIGVPARVVKSIY
jgi:sugar O-acyltransferase (sialic acid O-acetyltransferase NeuD family)